MSSHVFPRFSLLRGFHLRENNSHPSIWSCLREIAFEFERRIGYAEKGSMFSFLTHQISFLLVVLVGYSLLIWSKYCFPFSSLLSPSHDLLGFSFLISTTNEGKEF